MKRFMRRTVWCLRQLLPLTYRSRYGTDDGRRWFCVWQMWFGRSFNIDTVQVAT